MNMVRTVYTYQPVSGATILGNPTSLPKAKRAIMELRQTQWPNAEIERVLTLSNGKRYWRWRSGRWSFRNHYDPTPKDLARWNTIG